MASRPPGPPAGGGGGGMPMGGGGGGMGVMGGPPGGAPPPGGPAAPPGGQPGQPGQPPPTPDEMFKSILAIGQQIDAMLKSFAQAMPTGAKFFAQATQLIQQGIAAEMAQAGGSEPATTSPTAAGSEFPGGGFGSRQQ